jgi:membrane-associated protease RseP (regulator of RpoE activity)
LSELHKADSVGGACALGLQNTWESLSQIFIFFRELATRQISPRTLGGPATIVVAGGTETKAGLPRLLLFLMLLNINLAVLNLLPVPGTDGGHLLFLAIEGIQRRPVRNKAQAALIAINLVGVPCLLCTPIIPCFSQLIRLIGLIRTKNAVSPSEEGGAGQCDQHDRGAASGMSERRATVGRVMGMVLLIILGLWVIAATAFLLLWDVIRFAQS